MQNHALEEDVFIRSMATRGHQGGLALAAPEAIRVLVAAGLPFVLVETVGVGQVEVEIAGEADTTVVVVNPGWGDAIQASKAGLLEVADVFVVNKADRPGAAETERDLEVMLDMNMSMGDWRPPVVPTNGSTGEGVDQLWSAVIDHREYLQSTVESSPRGGNAWSSEMNRLLLHLATGTRREGDARRVGVRGGAGRALVAPADRPVPGRGPSGSDDPRSRDRSEVPRHPRLGPGHAAHLDRHVQVAGGKERSARCSRAGRPART